ncbi:MAG: hypothetical protein H8D23_32700 [Candidatus Brocadiales bacterium]|nr:hypothetical protein [Candidatus Brocadiales bacterium]
MRIEYKGKVHETEITEKGHVISKTEGYNIYFGPSEEEIVNGTVIADVIEYVEPVEEPVIVLPTVANLVAEIKEFMDAQGIEYNSSDLKSDLLQKIDWFYAE